jgi:hypothetical protein
VLQAERDDPDAVALVCGVCPACWADCQADPSGAVIAGYRNCFGLAELRVLPPFVATAGHA